MEVVDEVLRMDGVEVPKQIPLLDSHDRGSVRNVMGSIRDLEVRGSELVGRAYFASHDDAVRAFENYRDGHLTDFSIGARELDVEYDGSQKFVTRSQPVEGSAVAIGADPNAKVDLAVRAYVEPETVRDEMQIEKLRTEFDVPESVKDADVVDYVARKFNDLKAKPEPKPEVKPEPEPKPAEVTRDIKELEQEFLTRIAGIDALCRQHKIDDTKRAEYIKSGESVDAIARKILEDIRPGVSDKAEGLGEPVEVTRSEHDKWADAVRDGLTQKIVNGRFNVDSLKRRASVCRERGLQDCVQRIDQSFNNPSEGANNFRYSSFADIARSFLTLHRRPVNGMPNQEIIREAMRLSYTIERDGAYHSTGSFTNLLLDASNKTLLAAYVEAPSTWEMWARRAAPAPDFKNLNRIRFGELPNPEMVAENHPYPDKSVSDSKESYSVDKYGEIFSVTLEALVNDDLDAMARIPAMHGAAMRRKVNQSVYAVLTDNADLSDGTALFAAGHSNTATDALATGAMDSGYVSMKVQTGISSDAILNVEPRYLIVPPALEHTALTITRSVADPTSTSNTADFNEGTQNLYGPNGPRQLMVVSDAYLSSSTSATTWFLAADSSQVDTVEVTFLQGEETPVLQREDGFDVDAIKFKCRQTWGTAAIDYRGLYRGNT